MEDFVNGACWFRQMEADLRGYIEEEVEREGFEGGDNGGLEEQELGLDMGGKELLGTRAYDYPGNFTVPCEDI